MTISTSSYPANIHSTLKDRLVYEEQQIENIINDLSLNDDAYDVFFSIFSGDSDECIVNKLEEISNKRRVLDLRKVIYRAFGITTNNHKAQRKVLDQIIKLNYMAISNTLLNKQLNDDYYLANTLITYYRLHNMYEYRRFIRFLHSQTAKIENRC